MKGYVCAECGLDYETVSQTDAAVAIRSYPRRFKELLDRLEEPTLRTRPSAERWSAVEYAAHVADVFPFMAEAQRRTRIEDHPSIAFFDPDERAATDRYGEQDQAAIIDRMKASAEAFATEVESVGGNDWGRKASYDWGDRDALTMLRNGVHEGVHHLRDAEESARLVGGTPTDEED